MTAPLRHALDWARIAHDLRSPLMPLRTAAWLLRNEGSDSDRARELVDIVDRQSNRLARMVDELSDWGRSSEGAMPLNRGPVDAALALDMIIGAIPDCHVVPVVEGDASEMHLHADQQRLGMLLRTLIEHAMHRDPSRSPEVSLSKSQGRLQVRVRDQGTPLDADAQAALLNQPLPVPFDDGLGLRLLLAGRIAEAHGGRLVVDTTTTEGLAMQCILPAQD